MEVPRTLQQLEQQLEQAVNMHDWTSADEVMSKLSRTYGDNMRDVKHFPYRTGRPVSITFSVPRHTQRHLEIFLCAKCKVSPDNHTCFSWEYEYKKYLGVWFTDGMAHFCAEIEERLY